MKYTILTLYLLLYMINEYLFIFKAQSFLIIYTILK